MHEFTFWAPSLFDPGAEVHSPGDRFHGASDVAPDQARRRGFVLWLMRKLASHGYRVDGPEPDEEGWIIAVPSNGASVQFVIYGHCDDETHFVIDLVLLGPADAAIAAATEAILRAAPEISGLAVR